MKTLMLKVSQLIKNLRQLDPDAVIVDMDLTIEIDPEIGFFNGGISTKKRTIPKRPPPNLTIHLKH